MSDHTYLTAALSQPRPWRAEGSPIVDAADNSVTLFCHGNVPLIVDAVNSIDAVRAELERMRTALVEIEFATRENALFTPIHEVAVRALNPHPAPPEKA